MRKLWFMAVAALFVIAVAAPSFSAETTFSGSYRIRGVMDYNWDKRDVDMAGGINTDPLYTGYFDQRFRLTITHKRSEFLKAVVSIDLFEDTWGEERAGRINNTITGPTGALRDGFINTAYIEAVTPIGMIKVGTDGTTRFGYGLWSDSGMQGNGDNNPSITYAIKVKSFIATATFTKYMDLNQNIIDAAQGIPAGSFLVWPGRTGLDAAGGPFSSYYNKDVDTYTVTMHYIQDKWKVGALMQWIIEPSGIGGGYLIKGFADIGNFPGTFEGESNGLMQYYASFAGPTNIPVWPLPQTGTVSYGYGRMGMYASNIFIFSIYGDVKLLNDKLDIHGEFVRIFGTGNLTSMGHSYNNFLDVVRANGLIHPLAGPQVSNTLLPGHVLPDEMGIDGLTAYIDVSYDFEVAKIGLAFLYGGGEEHWRPYTQTHYNFNTTGNGDFHWGNIIQSGDWQFLNSVSPLGLDDNPENITSVKLYWSVNPMEKLDIHGNFIWAKYTVPVGRYAEDANGNLVNNWNAFYGHPMNYLLGQEYTPANISDQLGWEIDLGLTYEIMEGLSLNSEFGVLFTGEAFDYRDPADGSREEWGPIYRWANTLTYEF